MDKLLKELEELNQRALTLGEQMRLENRVARAELEDRTRRGLHGDDAIRHYNEWMRAHGLHHLVID